MADWNPFYARGTVSVANGGTTVTGVGTAWTASLIRAGDLFVNADFTSWAMITEAPTTPDALSITAWPGTPLAAGSPYRIWRISDGDRIIAAHADIMAHLVPNLSAFGGLPGGANKQPYFTGVGALALADLTPFGRALQALTGANGSIPVATGAGTAAMRAIVGTVSQAGGVPTGSIVQRGSNANGQFIRWADGTQICMVSMIVTDQAIAAAYGSSPLFLGSRNWTFPAAFTEVPVADCAQFWWGTAASWGSVTNVTTTVASLRGFDAVSRAVGTETKITATAIGRWY